MKKKLEADLISIAHRILQLKNKEDIKKLHEEARNVYEKLSVLLFVEDNFTDAKPTIGLKEIEAVFDKKLVDKIEIIDEKITENLKTEQKEIVEATAVSEEIIVPNFELEVEEVSVTEVEAAENNNLIIEDIEPILEKTTKKEIIVEEFANTLPIDMIFERVSDQKKSENNLVSEEVNVFIEEKVLNNKPETENATNLNEQLNKKLELSLNDRLAFEQELFDFSKTDFNRVINQISTFENFSEAKDFINDMVKPDYNNWNGKDEFVDRFMKFVENKFV